MKVIFRILSAAILPLFLVFVSCKEESQPAPIPVAAFTQNRDFIERNESITFTNTSSNATRYEWDFGNGLTSTLANPTVTFPNPRYFRVKLKVYNADGKSDTTSTLIRVGIYRILEKIKFHGLNFQDIYGNPWDADGSGPDIWMQVNPSQTTSTFLNISPGSLPLEWVYGGTGGIPLDDRPNTYTLFETDNYAKPDRVMAQWTVNPGTLGTKDYTTGKGSFTLVDNQNLNRVQFFFQVY